MGYVQMNVEYYIWFSLCNNVISNYCNCSVNHYLTFVESMIINLYFINIVKPNNIIVYKMLQNAAKCFANKFHASTL